MIVLYEDIRNTASVFLLSNRSQDSLVIRFLKRFTNVISATTLRFLGVSFNLNFDCICLQFHTNIKEYDKIAIITAI